MPDVFQKNALGRDKGKRVTGGGPEVCVSHLSLPKVQETWAGAIPVAWAGLAGLVPLCPAAPGLGVCPVLVWQGRGQPLAPLDSPSRLCSSCPYPPCCSLRAVLWARQRREPLPARQALQCGTVTWHRAEVSAWPRLRTCLGRTPGQPRCLILMGPVYTKAWGPQPRRSFSQLLGQLGFLLAPSTALRWDEGLGEQGTTSEHCLGLGLPLGHSFAGMRHCPSWIQARERGKALGLLEWGCEVGKGAGWPLRCPEVEVKGSSIQALLFGGEERDQGKKSNPGVAPLCVSCVGSPIPKPVGKGWAWDHPWNWPSILHARVFSGFF